MSTVQYYVNLRIRLDIVSDYFVTDNEDMCLPTLCKQHVQPEPFSQEDVPETQH